MGIRASAIGTYSPSIQAQPAAKDVPTAQNCRAFHGPEGAHQVAELDNPAVAAIAISTWDTLADKALAGEPSRTTEALGVLRAPDEEVLALLAPPSACAARTSA